MQHPSPSSPLSHPLPLHSHTFPICQPREQNLQPGQSQQGSLEQKGRMHLQAPITASLSTPLRSFPPQKKKKKKKRKLSCQKAFLLHKTDSVGNLPLKHPLAILSHTAAMQAAASIPALSSGFPLDKGSTAAGSNADPHMSLLSPTSA